MSQNLPTPQPDNRGWPWDQNRTRARRAPASRIQSPPRITVVTPSYNQGAFLESTIRSVLLQEYPNLQYIVVDGGSTDESGEILDKYASQNLTIIREPDNGQSDAICKGLNLAEGEFFNWINSDDLLMPGTLWELATLSPKASDLFTFPVTVFGDHVHSYLMKNENLSAAAMLRADRYSFSQPGLWFRTELVHQCGGIDRELNYGFDWDLLVRYLAMHRRVHYSDFIGAAFRLHDASKTVVEFGKTDEAANRFRQESRRIRDKLEAILPASFARASKLGRLREPWNQYLVDLLDDRDRSPLAASVEIIKKTLQNPRARLSRRTVGSVLRLLSRYVRPKASIGPKDARSDSVEA